MLVPSEVIMAANDGWCPFATARPITNSGNFETGRAGHTVKAVVLHIGEGPLSAFFPTFNNPARHASSHFMVGKKGEIEQYVSIVDTAYANGLRWDGTIAPNGGWRNPRGIQVSPAWTGLIRAVNPNYYTISIEHEGHFQDAWTDSMYLANLKLLQWIQAELVSRQGAFVYTHGDTLIGHSDFDTVDRANCPGPNCPFDKMVADTAADLAATPAPTPAPATPTVPAPGTLTPVSAAADLVRAALVAGANKLGIPFNDQSGLAQFALQNRLGVPLSDEFSFTVNGVAYTGQVWSQAVVYVPASGGQVQRT